jgi:2-deoxystreptamine N-acetyl-D-glucosaminyltransferase/2-deoxystreptamine glucosyltransferase
MKPAPGGLRIGILSARFPPAYYGGAELQAAELARRLARRHRVVVFTRDGTDPRVLDHWRSAGFEIVGRRGGGPPLLRSLSDLASCWSAFRAQAGTLVVIIAYQVYGDGLLGLLGRRVLGVPLVIWVRGEIEVRPEQSVKTRLLSRRVLAAADRVFVQSERLLEATTALLGGGSAARRPIVVPNGLALPDAADGPRAGLLFVGRLVRRKGVEHLLQALRQLPGVSLDVVGTGPDLARLRGLAQGLPVVFHGARSPEQVAAHLRGASALVLPATHGEGTPNVVLEAMAHGLPVIATLDGGIADILQDGESGLLVPPGDVGRLASAIRRLLEDAPLRGTMSEAARRVAATYCWDRVVPLVERELASLVGRRGGSRA